MSTQNINDRETADGSIVAADRRGLLKAAGIAAAGAALPVGAASLAAPAGAQYAPWGNLVAYHRGFLHSNDLVHLGRFHLGRFTSGIEPLSKKDGEFNVRIEAAK